MNKGKRVALAVLFDMLFLAAIVFAVSVVVKGTDCAWKISLSKVLIVLLIPGMFYMTYMSAAGDKYDRLPDELNDDLDETSGEALNEASDEASDEAVNGSAMAGKLQEAKVKDALTQEKVQDNPLQIDKS